MKLTEYQKTFLIDKFFKLNDSFIYWQNIANKLIDDGECIATGDKCIWVGGIGNFIRISKPNNLVGCIKYEFKFDEFINSEYFRVVSSQYTNNLDDTINKLKQEYNEVSSIKYLKTL